MEDEEQIRAKEAEIRALLAAGQYREAADRYLELAEISGPPRRQTYRLQAAEALVAGHALSEARKLLAGTDMTGMPVAVLARKDIVEARIALSEYRPYDALSILQTYQGKLLPPAEDELLNRALADAYAEAGNPIEAARARVALELSLTDPAEIEQNRRIIWEQLNRIQPAVLVELSPPPPDTLGGWMQLAAITNEHAASFAAFSSALPEWQSQFPGHPANRKILPELLETLRYAVDRPSHIALLLPQEGRFANAAAAVRNGFISAWFADDRSLEETPAVSVYDASPATLWTVYQHAVDDGADFIVGPLDRESVSLLAGSERLPLPTLALNQAEQSEGNPSDPIESEEQPEVTEDEDQADETPLSEATGGDQPQKSKRPALGLYQFALSPEDEARRVAERAWLDGHSEAAVIRPDSAWGIRVAEAFSEAWLELGGVVVEQQTYGKEDHEIAASVKRLLNVDESEQRARLLRWKLGPELKHEPRRRQDVDFVFMAAFPRQARQIRPQLKFQRASEVPVYATSHVFQGKQNAERDRDVDGVVFGDMPWLLTPKSAEPQLQEEINAHWPATASQYRRLYAFGIDAYRLIPHLGRLRVQSHAFYEGVTGQIGLDDRGRVQRGLVWARFRGGRPRLLYASPISR